MLPPVRRIIISLAATAACLAALGGAALAGTTHWANLRAVTVTVQNGSLPPPYSRARTKRFKTARQLRTVTAALNRNRIARGANVPNNGCTGGFVITIAITPHHGKQVRLSGYRCGGHTFGRLAGDVPAFMRAIGVKAP